VRQGLNPAVIGAGWEEFRDLWLALEEKPDGLLVCDDCLLDDVCVAIRTMKISVPDDLMIVTHANKGSGRTCPFPVWALEFDPDAFADQAAKMLLKLINSEPLTERHVVLPATLRECGRNEFVAETPRTTVSDPSRQKALLP
jgi:DNA-binding LacI/PurR family transcriptional regulator